MKKRKIFLGLALAVATVFTLGSCGDTEEETPAASSQAAASSQVVASSEAAQSSQVVASSEAAQSSEVAASSEVAQSSEVAASSEAAQSSEAAASSEAAQSSQAAASSAAEAGDEEKSIKLDGVEKESIAAALAAIPTTGTNTYTITLGKGTYNENDLAYKGSATVKIVGETNTKYGADVIISGHGTGTANKTRCTIELEGTGNVILENITIINDWTRANGEKQAEALGTDTTGYTVAYNCAFKSYQDTIRTVSKSWFYGCYIEGDTDFIWMESSSIVGLYEKCEIVSVYDPIKGASQSYIAAPKTTIQSKVGKGLVFLNSTVKESDEAKANGQQTYLARTPWSSGYYNQVAYINTTCSDIEASVWKGSSIADDYPETVIGWKMDQATATSLGYAGNNDILDADTVSKEFSGRRAILNRIYNTAKGKYEKDIDSFFDIDAVIEANNYVVDEDTSKALLDDETEVQSQTYLFDGTENDKVANMCNGFNQESGKTHFVGNANSTITVPVTGKCTVRVIGYYSGITTAKGLNDQSESIQGESVMDFDTAGSTSTTKEYVYTVYSDDVKNVVITAVTKTYLKKIVVEYDSSIVNVPVTDIEVTASSTNYTVGVALNLSATVNPTNATNSCVKWTSSDTTIATIDQYSGKVTFLKAGEEVTFTATALDGSGKTGTFACTAVEATWTACEWYTKDGDLIAETGADGISNFNTNSSSNKSLGGTFTFNNLAGDPIQTTYGIKLNGSGMLTISTTNDDATLTLITTKDMNVAAGSMVNDDPKVTDGTTTLTYATKVESDNYVTYTYRLATAGIWNISRSGTKESQPIIYAKCVYDAIWDFRDGGTPSTMTEVNIQGKTGTVVSNHSSLSLTVDATCNSGKLQYNSAQNGYAQFNAGTIIQVPVVNVGSVITVTAFPGQYNYTVAGTAAAANETTYTVTAEDVTKGYVEIVATATAYICAISVTNPR